MHGLHGFGEASEGARRRRIVRMIRERWSDVDILVRADSGFVPLSKTGAELLEGGAKPLDLHCPLGLRRVHRLGSWLSAAPDPP